MLPNNAGLMVTEAPAGRRYQVTGKVFDEDGLPCPQHSADC